MTKLLLDRKIVFVVTMWAFLIGIPPSGAYAMPSESIAAFTVPSVREAQMDHILSVLSRPEARAHLMMMGITEKELKEKLLRLDDQQLALVSDKADQVNAGGSALGLVIVLLVIAVLIILIVKLSDKTVVVKDK